MLKKRSIVIAGHATSVSLEPEFWDVLKAIAEAAGVSINQLVAEIDQRRTGNLSSAIRVHVLEYLQKNTPGAVPTGGG
jgi:predicted DNA-binding ribbon-helix-helix protein